MQQQHKMSQKQVTSDDSLAGNGFATGSQARNDSNKDLAGMHRSHSGMDSNDSANQVLESLGYKPELQRNRSTWQVAFMSFVLASIPYGLATTMFYPLIGGGPVNIIWGWVLVSLIIICVAASLGEITSVYPTAGGVYYQAFMLADPSWRRAASWICGWLYVVGNITITLAVNFGTTLFLVACINVFKYDVDGVPTGIFEGQPYQVFLIFLGLTLFCNAVSSLGNKWLPILDVGHPLNFLRYAPLVPRIQLSCTYRGNIVILTRGPPIAIDCRHFLDLCWRHCDYGHGPCACQGRSP